MSNSSKSLSGLLKYIHSIRYFHFFVTGVTGVAINLAITWLLTTFVFGLANYFYAYLIGLSINLIYNFTLHTYMTFQTKERHGRRFVVFVLYSLAMSGVQALLVKSITPLVGLHYYLLVITSVIAVLSTVNFIICRLFIFKE